MPAEIDANRLAIENEPTRRTVLVEQFCSWSACRISSMTSSARAMTGSTSYSSHGLAEHHPQEVRRVVSASCSGT